MLSEEQRLKHNARGRARYRENIEKKKARRDLIKFIISMAASVLFVIAVTAFSILKLSH
jgi:hypothetical protein